MVYRVVLRSSSWCYGHGEIGYGQLTGAGRRRRRTHRERSTSSRTRVTAVGRAGDREGAPGVEAGLARLEQRPQARGVHELDAAEVEDDRARALAGRACEQARGADQVELALGDDRRRRRTFLVARARKVVVISSRMRARVSGRHPGVCVRRASGSMSRDARRSVRTQKVRRCPLAEQSSAAERERLIVEHLPLVRGLARRYADRGEPLDDLVQVGTIGLIKAIDRFEPERGFKLASFATPTILGEIRRHFRDRSWTDPRAARHPGGPGADLARRHRALGRERPQPDGPRDRRIDRPLDGRRARRAGRRQRPAPRTPGLPRRRTATTRSARRRSRGRRDTSRPRRGRRSTPASRRCRPASG